MNSINSPSQVEGFWATLVVARGWGGLGAAVDGGFVGVGSRGAFEENLPDRFVRLRGVDGPGRGLGPCCV